MIFVDNFAEKLEGKIHAAYDKILIKKHLQKIPGKTLNCNSYKKIAVEVTAVRDEGLDKKLTDLEIANKIIHTLLLKKYFVHYNHEMAVLIGYLFLTMHGVEIHNYSVDAITNDSTLEDVRNLTAKWK
jgi:prophage maintenance system killer protein